MTPASFESNTFARPAAFMSLRKLFRNPLSIGLAVGAVAAAFFQKSRKLGRRKSSDPSVGGSATSPDAHADELRQLARKLLTDCEDEKARLARDLHDGLGSTLTAVNLDLYWVQQRLADQPQLAARLGRAIDVLASTVEIKRRIIHSLRPAALDNLGLPLAIESNVAEFEKTSPVPVHMDLPGELPAMTEQSSIALFRIYQEALAHAADHPEVTGVTVAVREEKGGVSLEISDDGVCPKNGYATLMVLTMHERAAALNGSVSVAHGNNGRGTTVKAFLPNPYRKSATAALAET